MMPQEKYESSLTDRFEIRISKSETNPKLKTEMTETHPVRTQTSGSPDRTVLDFGFRSFVLVSDFGYNCTFTCGWSVVFCAATIRLTAST